MNVQSLVFFLILSFLIFGCYHKESDDTLDAYMEIVGKMKANNSSLDENIDSKIALMKNEFKRKSYYIPLHKAAKDIFDAIREFNVYLDDVNKRFYTLTGSDIRESYSFFYDAEKSKLRNKRLVNDFFINGYQDKYGRWIAPEGVKINNKITETKNKIIAILNHLSNDKSFAITSDELEELFSHKWLLDNTNISESLHSNWEENKFKNQSVAASYVTLIMLQNDALLSAQMMIYYLSSKVGGQRLLFDKYVVVSSPKKNQVIKGEAFETDIFISQASSQAEVIVKVNGKELEVEQGVATYKAHPSKRGEHRYKAEITVKNPHNNKTETYTKTFKYEVGERCY